jgi:RNA ligase (TIGR02306 family)
MSTIKVEVVPISDVRPHPNADALELATVGGWQMAVKKGAYRDGDPIVYFEQGTVLPVDVAEHLGVTRYLSEKTDIDGNRVLVVHRVKLRGEPSFGLVVTPEPSMILGQNVARYYRATKFMPPVKSTAGDAEVDHPLFARYTDIENLRSYPDILKPGETVVATEKLHGANCRVGVVRGPLWLAGSKTLRRKDPGSEEAAKANRYWYPLTLPPVRRLLLAMLEGHEQVILFGEVYGKGIQNYQYGERGIAFRAFDLMVDGRYMDYAIFNALCVHYDVEMVPLAYLGPYSIEKMAELSSGPSLVGGEDGREGVVVRPAVERFNDKIGRVVLKYVGDEYLFKQKEDFTDQ